MASGEVRYERYTIWSTVIVIAWKALVILCRTRVILLVLVSERVKGLARPMGKVSLGAALGEDTGDLERLEPKQAIGFNHLYQLLSGLTHSRGEFLAKMELLLRMVQEPNAQFSINQICALMPEWAPDFTVLKVRQLAQHGWLFYDDGYYAFSPTARTFFTVLPVFHADNADPEGAALNLILRIAEVQEDAGGRLQTHMYCRANAIRLLKQDRESLLRAMESGNFQRMEKDRNNAERHLEHLRALRSYEDKVYQATQDNELHREAYATMDAFQSTFGDFVEQYARILSEAVKSGGHQFTRKDFSDYLFSAPLGELEELVSRTGYQPVLVPRYDEGVLFDSARVVELRDVPVESASDPTIVSTVLGDLEMEPDGLTLMRERLRRELSIANELHVSTFGGEDWAEAIFDLATVHCIDAENASIRDRLKPDPDFELRLISDIPCYPEFGCLAEISDTALRRR